MGFEDCLAAVAAAVGGCLHPDLLQPPVCCSDGSPVSLVTAADAPESYLPDAPVLAAADAGSYWLLPAAATPAVTAPGAVVLQLTFQPGHGSQLLQLRSRAVSQTIAAMLVLLQPLLLLRLLLRLLQLVL